MTGITILGGALIGSSLVLSMKNNHPQTLDDYLTHYWLIGKTGHFKSTYIREDLFLPWKKKFPNSSVVYFITKDEDDLNSFLDTIPLEYQNKVLVYAPTDMHKYNRWIGLNILARTEGINDSFEDSLLTNELVACFERAFGEAIKSNSKDILRNCTLAVLDVLPRPTILEVYKMINDDLGTPEDTIKKRKGDLEGKSSNPWRDNLISSLKNKRLKRYYETSFIRPTIRTMDIWNPIANKLRIVNDPVIANTLCQGDSLNLKDYINDGWIIVFYFPKGELGPENSRLLSSIAFSKLQMAIQSRSSMTKKEILSCPIMIIADEYQDYVSHNTSFQDLLTQSRAFGASLILSQQYIKRTGDMREVLDCIDGNVGNIVCGRLGTQDSRFIEDLIEIPKDKIMNLPKLRVVEKLMIKGKPKKARYRNIGIFKEKYEISEQLRQKSISEFGVSGDLINRDINTRLYADKISSDIRLAL